MNKISVTYEWLKTEPTILINGEPLDILNENLSVLRRDFHFYAPSFFKILDNYFGDSYSVDFNGTSYQCNCLKELSLDSQYCTSVNCSVIPLILSYDDVFGEMSRINTKYSLGEMVDAPFTVKDLVAAGIRTNKVFTVVSAEAIEKILICRSDAIPAALSAELVICPAEKYGVYKAGDKYMFTMPQDEIPLFMEYYSLFTCVMPFTNRVIRKLSRITADNSDNLIVTAIRKQAPQYILNLPSTVDAGMPAPFTFGAYPGSAAARFTLSGEGPGTISLAGGSIVCEKGGSYQITVKTNTDIVLETRTVTAIEHCLVQSIKLAPDFAFLMENAKGQISAYVTPDYAEDANRIVWSSSNPDIAHVSQNGQVTAFKAGVTVIKASTTNASAEYQVRVKKALASYSVSQNSARIRYTESLTLKCIPEPYDADIDSIKWKLNNPQAGTLTTYDNGYTCVFTPKDDSYSCTVECNVNGALKGQTCSVQVEGPKSHNALFIFAILLSVIGWAACLIAMIVMGIAGGGSGAVGFIIMLAPLVLSFIGMFTHKKKRYIAFLIIDAVVMLLTMLIGAGV